MKTLRFLFPLLFLVAATTPAFPVAKEIIQLQTQVQALQDQMARMQQSFDERMGVMRQLIEGTTDKMNQINAGMTDLQRTQKQQQAPPPDVLYNNALRDYNAAKYDLASQEFSDYIKFYSNTDLAGNAQFYLADLAYRQGNYEEAVKQYDKVLEQYPGGNKAPAAQLKKGFALLELGRRNDGVRELNSLVRRYPRSLEADQARKRLASLGAKPSAARPLRRPGE